MFRHTLIRLAIGAGRSVTPHKPTYRNMLRDPSKKYKAPLKVPLARRDWPGKTISRAPRWLSTDLRDGNQALSDPMSLEQKKAFFHKLIEIGFKEIEVAFPSASQTDFDFTRYAVENAPDDVSIQCLVQSREHLIRRTVEALRGARRATVHTYLATSDMFREIVFNMTREEAITKAVEATRLVRSLTKDDPAQQSTRWTYEFSPECFSETPVEYAVEVCEAVKAAWEPTEDNPIIFNLPATVEVASPNVYADQIEYFCKHISEREKVCVSMHTHNDRGCAVAATELGLLAGADRVEGCLFGSGERTGNVDLVTVALNMYTHGISPELDFSDIPDVTRVVERCNKIQVHPRTPYGGDLVVCAFSGSHQDAIKKGFAYRDRAREPHWRMPYLPLDPADVGRDYEAVIRVNSQSGKGGAAWIIQKTLGLDMPRDMQTRFSTIVQDAADSAGRELQAAEIAALFSQTYNYDKRLSHLELLDYDITRHSPERRELRGIARAGGRQFALSGFGNGPVSAFVDALNNHLHSDLSVAQYAEHSLGSGSSTRAAAFILLSFTGPDGRRASRWGVGVSEDVADASTEAVVAAANCILEAGGLQLPKQVRDTISAQN
ncbi:AFL229Wp [Eremothecium gossypii ATCC 10895]|uniref:2-isopropylmalate synthase n=1 Tax=Eremothecium gossypii (strain ATCC 10895 / CBS 109.51 / FGSC 9923 / NRRL Y-1056) TaxID=284811 RepID=Q755P2_EREGS|nr:AFL229Wp [Eremothecium gossypii ATCC 10895]AAS53145.2 AFL229Wp [Eremothecium gossypii ATCC 10895]AEY97455.1 FAFL229Wp [Eremothecium gossypii FDAG1]